MIRGEQTIKLFDAVNMTTNVVSISFPSYGFQAGSMQFCWDGASATDAQIVPQVSNDGINWCDLVGGSSVKTVDAPTGCQFYLLSTLPGFKFWRAKFVANSETTGTITCIVHMNRSWGENR